MSRARVVLRCDGGARTGWGHAMRCLALADALRDDGLESVFVSAELSPELRGRIERAGHRVMLATSADAGVEAVRTELASAQRAAIVLDHYELDQQYLDRSTHALNVPRVVVDDLADRRLACDLVVNATPGAGELDYRGWGAARALLGPRFAMLRREFRGVARSVDEAEPLVLVTLGGSSLARSALEIASAVAELDRPLRVAVLAPTGQPSERSLPESARIEVHSARDGIAELLARSTLAVSAAGTTCFELAACGVPALLVVGADNQRPVAASWNAAGVFDTLGELSQLDAQSIARHTQTALSNTQWLTQQSRAGRAAVDGLGAARVASEIARLLR